MYKLAVGLGLLMASLGMIDICLAQDGLSSPETLVRKRIAASGGISPLGADLVGDEIQPATRNVKFTHEDVSLDGNGPPIRVQRTYDVAERIPVAWRHLQAFADWTLEVPRLETAVLADPSWRYGEVHVALNPTVWTVTSGPDPRLRTDKRCRNFGLPPMPNGTGGTYNANWMWWPGVTMKIPGQSPQKILVRSAQNSRKPVPFNIPKVSSDFPLVTSANWQVACTIELKNGVNGEGFFVVDPEGTKYWFDWMAVSSYHSFVQYNEDGDFSVLVQAADAALMATRVEDRFGNYVTYSYSGNNLTEIKANDGRHVKISWLSHPLRHGDRGSTAADYISSITIQPDSSTPRIIRYDYKKRTDARSRKHEIYATLLSKVTLPDNSTWEFSLDALPNSCADNTSVDENEAYCGNYVRNYMTLIISGSIKSPSGSTATFTFIPSKYSRNWDYPGREDDINVISYFYDDPSEVDYPFLIEKKIAGPGVDLTWKYSRGRYGFLGQLGAQGRYEDFRVLEPDGSVRGIEVNNLWRHRHEGRILRETIYEDATLAKVVKETTYTYADVNAGPYPTSLGDGSSFFIIPRQVSNMWPLVSTQIVQDGQKFDSRIATDCAGVPFCFDEYARPIKMIKSSVPLP